MHIYEQEYIAASDRLRECQRRMDALGKRWRAGDASVSGQLDELFGEFQRLRSEFYRAKWYAEQATKARATK